jgi:pyruvate dehydrogenase (quinone)
LKTTEKWRANMRHYVTRGPELTPIRPEYLVSTIDELASDDAVVCADTGTACIWTARYITAREKPNIFGSFSWASMANAMPNAIGAAVAYPGRQVIGLCGDGGLSMLMGDLLTIAERELPVKLVVLDNSGFQFVHIELEEAGIQPYGTKFANPDLAKVAGSIGLTGIRVEDPREVRDAVAELVATPGPALLDAVVDPYALSLPPHVSFGEAEGFSLSFAKQALGGNLDDVVQTVKANVHLV